MPTLVARDFGGLKIDTTDWPILFMEFSEGRFPDSVLEASLTYTEQLMRECQSVRGRCAQVTDLTRMQALSPASQRKIAGEWVKKNSGLILATSVGGATITPSSILRGLVTAVYWFHKPATASEFFATRAEALRYVIRLLEEARVPLPPRVCEIRERLRLELQPMREKQQSGLSWRR